MDDALVSLGGVVHVCRVRNGALEVTAIQCDGAGAGVTALSTVRVLSAPEHTSHGFSNQWLTVGLVCGASTDLLVLQKRPPQPQHTHTTQESQLTLQQASFSLQLSMPRHSQDLTLAEYPSKLLPLMLPPLPSPPTQPLAKQARRSSPQSHASGDAEHTAFIVSGPLVVVLRNGSISVASLLTSPRSAADWCALDVRDAHGDSCPVHKLRHVESVVHGHHSLCVLHMELEDTTIVHTTNREDKARYECVVFDIREMSCSLSQRPAGAAQHAPMPSYVAVHSAAKFNRPNVNAYALVWMSSLCAAREYVYCALAPSPPPVRRAGLGAAEVFAHRRGPTSVSCTCTAAGFITTYISMGNTHEAHMTKQLSLLHPMRVNRAVICPGAAGHTDPLLVIFCRAENNGVAATAATTPFALVLRLVSLEFLLEIRKAGDVRHGHFHDDVHASLLWLPAAAAEALLPLEENAAEKSAKVFPTLTTLPSTAHGAKMLKQDGTWKEVACGSAVSLQMHARAHHPAAVAAGKSTATGAASSTKQQGKKKRKPASLSTGVTAAKSITFVGNAERVETFADIAQAKQVAILAALQGRLQKIQESTQLVKAIEAQKCVELTSLRAAVAATLHTMHHRSGQLKRDSLTHVSPLSQIANKHEALFPAAQSDFSLKKSNMPSANSSKSISSHPIVSTVKSHGSISVYDCICLGEARSFSLLIIVRAMNTDTLPVFDASVTCSVSDLNISKGETSATLSCVSAKADVVAPQQEIWLSARVVLSPLHFATLADSAGRLYLNIGMIWRELNTSVSLPENSGTGTGNAWLDMENEKSVRKAFLETFQRDESRAALEVRNGWISSNTRGVVGAIASLTANDMHDSQHYSRQAEASGVASPLSSSSVQARKMQECYNHNRMGPFILARTYSHSHLHKNTDVSQHDKGEGAADRNWLRRILTGWLTGRAEQHKPMPSIMSQWPAPPGGIRYCSYISGIDFMLNSSAVASATNASLGVGPTARAHDPDATTSIDSVLQYLEREYEERASGYNSVCFVPQEVLSSGDNSNGMAAGSSHVPAANVELERNVFLRMIPELAAPASGYINRVVVSATLPHTGGVPARISAPVLPHTAMGGSDGPLLRAHTSLQLGLQHLQRTLPADITCVSVYATESRLDKVRMAAIYMIEDLKSWATACRMHRLRIAEENNKSIRNTHCYFPSSNNSSYGNANKTHANTSSVPAALVGVGKDMFATPAIAEQCKQKRLQADTAIIFAVEACQER